MQTNSLAILLAVYEPREDWLIQLLDSLNAQTYPNLKLYVREDRSPTYSYSRLRELLETHVTAFPWELRQNQHNVGSNKTFEALVRDCSEDLVAFCDQDDVWLPNKLKNGVELLETSPLSPTLVCSELRVIDGDGKVISPDMAHHRHRHVFLRGNGLAPTLFTRNFVVGCTVILPRERVCSYLPFPKEAVHDHYIAFRAALDGALDYLPDPQILYRVYGANQTGVMTGVTTKADYYRERIQVYSDRVNAFAKYAPDLPELQKLQAYCTARKQNFNREKGGMSALWRLWKCNPTTTLFELVALRLPTPVFRLAIRMIQKRMI